jgi:hypothetical protein
MRTKHYVAGIGAALLAALALSSTQQAAAGHYRPDRPVACTQEYIPVCAVNHGIATTYPNACVAGSAGARVVGLGRCNRRPVSVRG